MAKNYIRLHEVIDGETFELWVDCNCLQSFGEDSESEHTGINLILGSDRVYSRVIESIADIRSLLEALPT